MSDATTPASQLSGSDLRLLRQSRRVNAAAIARRLGVTSQRVASIEGSAQPTQAAIRSYLRALADLEASR